MQPYLDIRDFTQTPLCAEFVEKCATTMACKAFI